MLLFKLVMFLSLYQDIDVFLFNNWIDSYYILLNGHIWSNLFETYTIAMFCTQDFTLCISYIASAKGKLTLTKKVKKWYY